MNLKELTARGAFVLSAPVPRDVTWIPTDPATGQRIVDPETGEPAEPLTFTVRVRRPSAGWLDRARMAAATRPGAVSYRSAIISHAIIFDSDVDEVMTYEQAEVLQDALAEALMDAYNAVNSPPAPAPANDASDDEKREAFAKNSGPTPGSGTNSHEQASADERSESAASS